MAEQSICQKILQIATAAPGWFAVFEGDDDIYGHPVVVWALAEEGELRFVEGMVMDEGSYSMGGVEGLVNFAGYAWRGKRGDGERDKERCLTRPLLGEKDEV